MSHGRCQNSVTCGGQKREFSWQVQGIGHIMKIMERYRCRCRVRVSFFWSPSDRYRLFIQNRVSRPTAACLLEVDEKNVTDFSLFSVLQLFPSLFFQILVSWLLSRDSVVFLVPTMSWA